MSDWEPAVKVWQERVKDQERQRDEIVQEIKELKTDSEKALKECERLMLERNEFEDKIEGISECND